MNLLTYLVAIAHYSNVAGYNSADVGLLGSIQNLAHQGQVLTIYNSINRQVALYAADAALLGNAFQVVYAEGAGRVGPHVQVLDTEVDTVGSRSEGSSQTFG